MTATPQTCRWPISPPPGAILAHAWNGQDLTAEHGGPVRLIVPHLYLWKSAKWLQRIEFVACGQARLLGDPRLSRPRRSVAKSSVTRIDGANAGGFGPVAETGNVVPDD